MEFVKHNKKALMSLLSLLLCICLFVTGTFAWFTDTATVKGNKVMAGNLLVDIVGTQDEIMAAMGFTDEATKNASFTSLVTAQNLASYTSTNGVDVYWILTDKEVPLVELKNVEPGSTWPVSINVKNSGDLNISYSAGFSIDENMSKTGLQTLELQKIKLGDAKYNYIKTKLEKLQKVGGVDKGGHLEDVLEVYAMKESEFKNTTAPKMTLNKNLAQASCNYIGTVAQIMHCNDATYLASLNATTDAEEIAELEKVAERLSKASDGLCYTKELATGTNLGKEIGTAYFAIHMPEQAGNLYQNASITINVGVTATQADGDVDGILVSDYDKKENRAIDGKNEGFHGEATPTNF